MNFVAGPSLLRFMWREPPVKNFRHLIVYLIALLNLSVLARKSATDQCSFLSSVRFLLWKESKADYQFLLLIDLDKSSCKQEFSIPGLPGRDFAKSRDFWDGISRKFRIYQKKFEISQDYLFSSKNWPISYILDYLVVDGRSMTNLYLFLLSLVRVIFPILWRAARASGCSVLLVMWWPQEELALHLST